MLVDKLRSLPESGAPERWFCWGGSSLFGKYKTRLERLAKDKHSSLLQKLINYGHKKVYNIDTWSVNLPNS
jgi:hypothetical protein